MKLLKRSIILTSLALSILMLTNCAEDFEETTFEVIPNKDVTKVSVSGVVVSPVLDNDQGDGISNEPIPFATVKVYEDGDLITQSTADENGEYSFDFPDETGAERKYYIETSKSEYLPSVELLNPSTSTSQKKYLYKTSDPELAFGYSKDEVTISGKINYTEAFSITVNHRRSNGNGGWSRKRFYPDGNGCFSMTIPRGDVVTFRFANAYGCEFTESSMLIPESFDEDIDLGMITDIIIPNHLQIDVTDIDAPNCLSEGYLYINNNAVTTTSEVDYRLCDNVDQVEALMIDYENNTFSERTYPSISNALSLSFSECKPYYHSFSLTSTIGNFTQESVNIKILEHRFRSDVSGFDGDAYRLEFRIGDQYLFETIGTSFEEGKTIFGFARFTDLQREFSGLSITGSTPEQFTIENGYFTGTFEGTQQWRISPTVNGPAIDFEIEIRVPIID